MCSFEYTFCRNCAETTLGGRCPNCGGELVARPRRPAEKLAQYPASTVRVVKSDRCAAASAQPARRSRWVSSPATLLRPPPPTAPPAPPPPSRPPPSTATALSS